MNIVSFSSKSDKTVGSMVVPSSILSQAQRYQHEQDIPDLDTYLCDQLTDQHFDMYTNTLRLRFSVEDTFPVDFDEIWVMLGYCKKANAKHLLEQMTRGDTSLYQSTQVVSDETGRSVEKIYLTFDMAYRFALKANTDKADEIADFFITTWKCIQDYYVLSMYLQQKRTRQTSKVNNNLVVDTKHVVYIADLGVSIQDGNQFIIGYAHDIQQYFPVFKRVFKRAKLIQTYHCINSDQLIRIFLSNDLVRPRLTQFCYNLAYINIFTLDDDFTLPLCLHVFSDSCQAVTITGNRDGNDTALVLKQETQDLLAIEQERTRQAQLKFKESELENTTKLEIERELSRRAETGLKDSELENINKLEIERELSRRTECEHNILLEVEKEKTKQLEIQLDLQRLSSSVDPIAPIVSEPSTLVEVEPTTCITATPLQGVRGDPDSWPQIRSIFIPVGKCPKDFYVQEFINRYTVSQAGYNTSCKELLHAFNTWSEKESLNLTFEVSTQFANVIASLTPVVTKIRCHSSGNEQKGAIDIKMTCV